MSSTAISDRELHGTITGQQVRPMRRGGGWRRGAIEVGAYVALSAGSLVMALPFFWMLSTSLTARGMEFQVPPQWIPNPVVWGNYHEAVFESGLPFPRFFINTVIITLLSMLGTLFS